MCQSNSIEQIQPLHRKDPLYEEILEWLDNIYEEILDWIDDLDDDTTPTKEG